LPIRQQVQFLRTPYFPTAVRLRIGRRLTGAVWPAVVPEYSGVGTDLFRCRSHALRFCFYVNNNVMEKMYLVRQKLKNSFFFFSLSAFP
jgi:hypothetical protein